MEGARKPRIHHIVSIGMSTPASSGGAGRCLGLEKNPDELFWPFQRSNVAGVP